MPITTFPQAYVDRSFAPQVIAQSGVPIGVPPTGSVAANGAITLGTALLQTYSNIWLSFPAGALFAGSVAGVYFCQMSSTTLGTAYNIRLLAATPYVPTAAQLTAGAIVAAGPGAYTQSTSYNQLFIVTVPAGAMGANGRFVYTWEWCFPNNVNNKQINTNWGGVNGYTYTQTTSQLQRITGQITNRGVTNRQYQSNIAQDGSSGAAPNATIIADTALATTFEMGATIAVATDFLVIEACSFQILYGQ
jgi:hypothetical protein